jgi:proline iminopeptidase
MMMINCTLDMEDSILNGWLPRAAELLGDESRAILHDEQLPALERLGYAGSRLREKGLDWKIFYADPESKKLSDATYAEIENFNNDFSDNAMSRGEYFQDYTVDTPHVTVPVLFFYGKTDWSVGPDHYRRVAFPEMILWGSDVGHMPFLENRADLEKAIIAYIDKYGF